MRIYILGPVGSGKSTLARKISCALNTKYHELDSIVWKKTIMAMLKELVQIEISYLKKLYKEKIGSLKMLVETVLKRLCLKPILLFI